MIWDADNRLSFSSRAFRQMPLPAIDTHVRAKLFRCIVTGDLVRGSRQSFAFGRILALAAYGAC